MKNEPRFSVGQTVYSMYYSELLKSLRIKRYMVNDIYSSTKDERGTLYHCLIENYAQDGVCVYDFEKTIIFDVMSEDELFGSKSELIDFLQSQIEQLENNIDF